MKKASIVSLVIALLAGFTLQTGVANENHPNSTARASVNSVPRERILEISQTIDSLVQKKLAASGQKLNPLSSDSVFLRRAYLDIAGRIPSIDETRRFLKSKKATKRAELIDQLMDSYSYTSRQYNFWADLLRIKSTMPGGLTGFSYIDYVKDSLEQNKPYDEFVREMVSSSGANLERGNGAVGYYLRDRNMPEDNMSNTIRIFLGTRLECAQCHDHPFDKWTQRQYFEMVAFTGGIRYRAPQMGANYQDVRKMYRNKDVPEKLRPILNRMGQTLSHGITGEGTGLARLPENFLGSDGYDGEIVVARDMFTGNELTGAKVPAAPKKQKGRKPNNKVQQAAIPGAREIGSREVYANWLTDTENPRFAQVIANRLWKQAMGIGLIEPVDIIEDSTVASNPELMDFLTTTMVELDFDMKQFLRAIYNSNTYQAVAFSSDVTDPAEFGFNGPKVRRMSAEQIWDSLLTLTVPGVDERVEPIDQYGDPYAVYEKIKNAKAEDLLDLAQEIVDDRNKARGRARFNKNDPDYVRMQQRKKQLATQIKQAQKRRNTELVRKLMIQQAQVTTQYRQKRLAGQFQRASEMRSPAPAGHFLREFGQSDREVIDNSNKEPAVTQVLAMMNGYVEERISRDQSSVLMQSAIGAESAKECVEIAFLSMLNRKPTSQESRAWESDFNSAYRSKDQARIKEIFADLVWMLANSNEFIFIK